MKPFTKEQELDSKTREEPDGKGKKTDVVAKCVPDDALLGMTWHHPHTTLRVTPSRILKQLPQRIDHVAFADPILGSVSQTHQQREPPKEDLTECIQFMTDMPNDKVISAPDRDLEKMMAKVGRQRKPKRIAGIPSPADSNQSHGIFEALDRRPDGDGVRLPRRPKRIGQTPTTTSKTQKNWMKAFAEKARGQGHQKGQYKIGRFFKCKVEHKEPTSEPPSNKSRLLELLNQDCAAVIGKPPPSVKKHCGLDARSIPPPPSFDDEDDVVIVG